MPFDEPTLLKMRVSELLELHPGALDLLIGHGFAPLAQTHLRALLAPTVSLGQALRIRSLGHEAERVLLDELQALLATLERPATAPATGPATGHGPLATGGVGSKAKGEQACP